MEEILQITKAMIAKIWHMLKAKSITALEKYVSVLRFGPTCTKVLGFGPSQLLQLVNFIMGGLVDDQALILIFTFVITSGNASLC